MNGGDDANSDYVPVILASGARDRQICIWDVKASTLLFVLVSGCLNGFTSSNTSSNLIYLVCSLVVSTRNEVQVNMGYVHFCWIKMKNVYPKTIKLTIFC